MLWLVNYASNNSSRVLLVGDSAQHRSVERGDALRILERSGSIRYVELLKTQRQKVPVLKAAIEDLKPGTRVVVDIPEGSKDRMAHSVKVGVAAAAVHTTAGHK